MNYPLTSSGQVHAAAGLAEAVANRYGCVGVISRAAVGTAALLDQTERELSSRRIRCVRVQGPASGGLALRGLIAQVVAQPDPSALTDADLKAGFVALTEPGEGYGRVALLVAEAHSLLPSAVRYIQLARQSSPAKLCVVLAGQPSLMAALEGDDFAPLRSAMHMVELPELAGQGLLGEVSAVPKPPTGSRRGGSSPLVRISLAALVVPIVGLIWWRHLPAAPAVAVPSQDAPSLPAAIDPPLAAVPAALPAERAAEPLPSEPDPVAPQAGAGPTEPDPAPPASEAPAQPEVPAESSAASAAEPPTATKPSAAAEPPAAPEPPATAGEPPAIAAELPVAAEPPAADAEPPASAAPERSGTPTQDTALAETPVPGPIAPDAAPPVPDPAIRAKPQVSPPPRGTLTVTATPPARGGAKRAGVPVMAAPPVAAPTAASPARAAEDRPREDRPSLADERRCRDIVLKAQLGKDPSDADKQFLRNGRRGG